VLTVAHHPLNDARHRLCVSQHGVPGRSYIFK
jgi:hypothetical protein